MATTGTCLPGQPCPIFRVGAHVSPGSGREGLRGVRGQRAKLVEPVAQEGGFGRAEREGGPFRGPFGGLFRGVEGGVEGEGPGGEARVGDRGRVGGEGADEGVAHPRGDLRIAIRGRGADQRQGDAGDAAVQEAAWR